MGAVDTIVQKLKLLTGGKTRRLLFKQDLVDENGVATATGRTLARRLMAEKWVDEHGEELAKQFAEFAKLAKQEEDDSE